MASNAVLNIRLPEELKKHGNQVLEREGVSVSQVVRDLYEFMSAEQDVPSFAKHGDAQSKYEKRRETLRKLQGKIRVPHDVDVKDLRDERIMGRYGEIR